MTMRARPVSGPELSSTRPAHRRRRVSLLAVSCVLAVTGLVGTLGQAGPAVAKAGGTSQAAQAEQRVPLERLARDVVAAGAPGVIVRVDDGRGRPVEVVEQAAWSRAEQRLRAGDEFRMGSNTKTMMATVALQLVAEGRLALTDPVEKWLPGLVPNGRAITLRMLLNHTSGLYDYTLDPALLPSILGQEQRRWTSEQLLAVGVRTDPQFPPGARWSYSNTNYAAVGAVLEKVTGKSLAELVRDRITRPLGLKHTYFATDSTWRGRHARGYEPDAAHMPPGVPPEFREYAGVPRDGHVDVSDNTPSWGGAAGAVVSSAREWGRFYHALMSGELLPAAQLAQMRTTVPIRPDQPNGPGGGLGIQTLEGPCGRVWAHDGGIPGYFSTHFTDPGGKRTATVLIPTEAFAEHPEAFPKINEVSKELQTTAMCAMFDKPAPTR
ncbi:serine hydrolase domain-containing protein [Streptomyces flavofungini]|uniref:Beta-lactamase family protein n=1 Tax=Streptomyces flavofungini TaxID=68200 RepID=A0ABS0XGX5_9ACTN|nr:serine hydrolase domain-containing protein [Streptomyces flavofungini]MBJ3812474.1 beta-lactamase family protein [Streptomyces flavofungini]GHC53105.1 serine hydrolase [Streptomyces flavofungini]